MNRYAHLYSRSNASKLQHTQGSASETTPLLRAAGKALPTKAATALYPRPGALARLALPRAALARLFAKAAPTTAQQALHSGFGSVIRIGDDKLPLAGERGSASPPPPVKRGARGVAQQCATDQTLRADLLAARQAALAGLAGTFSPPDLALQPAGSAGRTAVPGGPVRLSGGPASLLLLGSAASRPFSSVCVASHPLPSTRRASSPGGGMLDAYRLIAALFPRASEAQLERLQSTLHGLELPAQADRTVLAYALAAATDGDIALTQRVLHGLKEGLDLGVPPGLHARRPTLVERSAWRTAALLSCSEDGFELLRALHPTHSGFGRAARVLLQTAPCEDRTAVEVRLGAQMPSLQERAWTAAVAMLTPERVLSDTEKAAFFAWEQGFREDGEGSPLHRVQQHLCKFAHKTIPRAQKSRLRSFLPRLFGSRKSPLSALRHGLHGADRTNLEAERTAMGAAATSAAARLQEVLAPHAAELLECARPLEALVALAMLQHRATQVGSKRGDQDDHRGPDRAPTPADIATPMRDILRQIDPDAASGSPSAAGAQAVHRALVRATRALASDPVSFLRTQPALRRQLARAITPSRLSAWGKLRGLAATDPFWRHLDAATLVGGSAGLKRVRRRGPGTLKRYAVQQDLGDLIDSMGSSARLRLADGSRRGLGTKGLSMNLSTLLHLSGIPLGPRLNLGRRTSRRAVVELGRASHGGEILIGTERLRRRVRGVGVMLGYDCHAGPVQVRCGISVDLDRSREKADVDAVLLRMAQRRCADCSVDEARLKLGMRKIVDFLFSESRAPKGPQAQASQLFERFAARFFDDPDLSIGLSNPSSRSSTTSMSAVASAMAAVGGTPLRLGPAVGLSGSRKASVQHDAGGQGGRLRGAAVSLGQSRRLAIGAGFKGKLGLHAPEEGSSAPVKFGLLDASLPSWNMTLRVNGQSAKARLMREHGRLVSENCFLDVEFEDVASYVAAVNAERSGWLASLSRRDAQDPDAPARARAALDAYLADVRCYARRNQRHVLRARLRPEVARAIDAHGTACALIRASRHLSASARERLCAAREAACAMLVAAPEAWMPAELKTLEQSATHVRLGLQLGLQLSTETSAEGEHQLASLKTGTP